MPVSATLNGLANMAARLHCLEPFNLYFCYLLQTNILADLHRDLSRKEFKKQLVLLLAHFVDVKKPSVHEKARIQQACQDSHFDGLLPAPREELMLAAKRFNTRCVDAFEQVECGRARRMSNPLHCTFLFLLGMAGKWMYTTEWFGASCSRL
jgi:hypothetical protein